MSDPLRRCAICGAGGAAWQHELDGPRAHFRFYGKGHVWGSPLELCWSCEQPVRDGDGDLLARRRAAAEPTGLVDDLAQQRLAIDALLAADLGGRRLDEVLPPGYVDAVADGFVALETVTGAGWIVRAWPAEHARAVPETRAGSVAADARCWFLRSPWPSLTTIDAVGLVIAEVERLLLMGPSPWRVEEAAEVAAAREVLAHDDEWARTHGPR